MFKDGGHIEVELEIEVPYAFKLNKTVSQPSCCVWTGLEAGVREHGWIYLYTGMHCTMAPGPLTYLCATTNERTGQ